MTTHWVQSETPDYIYMAPLFAIEFLSIIKCSRNIKLYDALLLLFFDYQCVLSVYFLVVWETVLQRIERCKCYRMTEKVMLFIWRHNSRSASFWMCLHAEAYVKPVCWIINCCCCKYAYWICCVFLRWTYSGLTEIAGPEIDGQKITIDWKCRT